MPLYRFVDQAVVIAVEAWIDPDWLSFWWLDRALSVEGERVEHPFDEWLKPVRSRDMVADHFDAPCASARARCLKSL